MTLQSLSGHISHNNPFAHHFSMPRPFENSASRHHPLFHPPHPHSTSRPPISPRGAAPLPANSHRARRPPTHIRIFLGERYWRMVEEESSSDSETDFDSDSDSDDAVFGEDASDLDYLRESILESEDGFEELLGRGRSRFSNSEDEYVDSSDRRNGPGRRRFSFSSDDSSGCRGALTSPLDPQLGGPDVPNGCHLYPEIGGLAIRGDQYDRLPLHPTPGRQSGEGFTGPAPGDRSRRHPPGPMRSVGFDRLYEHQIQRELIVEPPARPVDGDRFGGLPIRPIPGERYRGHGGRTFASEVHGMYAYRGRRATFNELDDTCPYPGPHSMPPGTNGMSPYNRPRAPRGGCRLVPPPEMIDRLPYDYNTPRPIPGREYGGPSLPTRTGHVPPYDIPRDASHRRFSVSPDNKSPSPYGGARAMPGLRIRYPEPNRPPIPGSHLRTPGLRSGRY